MNIVTEDSLKTLFLEARSQNGWTDRPVSDSELQQAYDIAKWGPTSMNTQPMRIVFVRGGEAKERLRPALAPTNIDKVMTAPVVAIIAYDPVFYTHMPRIFPHNPNAQSFFEGKQSLIQDTAFRNGTLQAAYFMIALRALGLDAGPMSGFDAARVDAEFFTDSGFKTNFLIAIGHGDPEKIFNRSPRFDFDEVTSIL